MRPGWLTADTGAGALVIAFGITVLLVGWHYPPGTVTNMGPGYLPRVLGLLCLVLGGALAARGVLAGMPVEGRWEARALVAVVAGIVAFALLIERAGLVITSIAVVGIVSLARPGGRPLPILLLGAGLAAFTVLVFIVALGLPFAAGPF